MSESGGGAGRREVAYRVFAAEFEDATVEHSEGEEERAPNYVVTPTGARANRLFVVGVLTEVESVSEDVLRGRVVDPTGAFVVYAGQYQPDPRTFLERADPPAFVAVTGKARTFTPDGSDRVLTSIRPESINGVDADTRDRWAVETAAHTIDRVRAFADALDRPERGDDLREALLAEGLDEGLAAGIPLAVEHYGTTEAYLAAVRDMAVEAAEVVAGERDEVTPVDLAPDEGGPADAAFGDGRALAAAGGTEPTASDPAAGVDASDGTADAADATGESEAASTADDPGGAGSTGDGGIAEPESEAADEATGSATDGDTAGAGAGEVTTDAGEGDVEDETEPGVAGEAAADVDEMYELDEEEREEIESEYGTEFETGTEVGEPGEADIGTPDSETAGEPASDTEETAAEPSLESEEAAGEPSPEPGGTTGEPSPDAADTVEAGGTGGASTDDAAPAADGPGEAESADGPGETEAADESEGEPAEETDAGAGEVDLEAAVVDAMDDLDEGDGAERDAVIDAVAEDHGVDAGAVEEAIQDALMSGKCYEPGEGRLKAI